MDEENQKFEALIDNLVYSAVTNGATNFNRLLKSLPGVYPSIAFSSLKRLFKTGKLTNEAFLFESEKQGLDSFENKISHNKDQLISLPIPHPLDYDWRFSEKAIVHLLELCLGMTEHNETIAFLGTPSLFFAAKQISLSRQVILLDKNSTVINYLSKNHFDTNIILCDIVRDTIPEIKASVVVTDPPWYEKHLFGFIWSASKICQLEGKILISLPPIGTRPDIKNDLERLFEWSKQLGLSLLKVEQGVLPYVSPPFELNALKVEDFKNLSKEWRHGDLAVFVKTEESLVKRPVIAVDLEENWLEEIVMDVRIKLKPYKSSEFDDPRLVSIVTDNIFPSVSRRDPRRPLVDVWTSGNRVYACKGRFVTQQILRAMALEQPVTKFLAEALNKKLTGGEKDLINKAKGQLSKIITTEREENLFFADGK